VPKELLMRLTPVLLTLAIAGGTMASAGHSQRLDNPIDPRSAALVRQAQAVAAADQNQATDLLETALAVDPRNREAYLGLARIAQAQRLPGKAIRLYEEALRIEPNDVAALAGQGEAYVQRGAVERARRNLARVQQLCAGRSCPQVGQLTASINRGPPVATAQAPAAPAPAATPPSRGQ